MLWVQSGPCHGIKIKKKSRDDKNLPPQGKPCGFPYIREWYNVGMTKKNISTGAVLEAVMSLDKYVRDMSKEMATKDYVQSVVEDAKEELLIEIRAVSKAVDKNSLTIIRHESRIKRLERHPALQ